MFARFDDFDRTFNALTHLRRQMDRVFDEYEPGRGPTRDALRGNLIDEVSRGARFPALTLEDTGATLVLEADVPGLSEKDLQLTVHQDVLSFSAKRKSDAPEGYFVHRQERAPVELARSFTLPCKVDPERCGASLKDGVLTITLTKAVEARPKQITVKAQ